MPANGRKGGRVFMTKPVSNSSCYPIERRKANLLFFVIKARDVLCQIRPEYNIFRLSISLVPPPLPQSHSQQCSYPALVTLRINCFQLLSERTANIFLTLKLESANSSSAMPVRTVRHWQRRFVRNSIKCRQVVLASRPRAYCFTSRVTLSPICSSNLPLKLLCQCLYVVVLGR
jgi:hypothetical protein